MLIQSKDDDGWETTAKKKRKLAKTTMPHWEHSVKMLCNEAKTRPSDVLAVPTEIDMCIMNELQEELESLGYPSRK